MPRPQKTKNNIFENTYLALFVVKNNKNYSIFLMNISLNIANSNTK